MYWYGYDNSSRIRELLDFISSMIVLSFAFSYNYIIHGRSELVPAVIIAITSSFALHEFAHRYIARANGAYAKYRAWYMGLLIALVLTIATQGRFTFAAPGAVTVYTPWYSHEIEASIALAGPLINIAIGFICLISSLFTQGIVHQYLRIIGGINSFIALFNLLPMPPLDGYKVFRANIIKWLISFVFSILLWIAYLLS